MSPYIPIYEIVKIIIVLITHALLEPMNSSPCGQDFSVITTTMIQIIKKKTCTFRLSTILEEIKISIVLDWDLTHSIMVELIKTRDRVLFTILYSIVIEWYRGIIFIFKSSTFDRNYSTEVRMIGLFLASINQI